MDTTGTECAQQGMARGFSAKQVGVHLKKVEDH